MGKTEESSVDNDVGWVVDWPAHRAVLFDLDGVVTPTAIIHERAWSSLFADYRYTSADYLAHIDGKPRYDGVASFLASRGVQLPWGDPDDPPGDSSICALGNRKNLLFGQILAADDLEPYPGTMEVIEVLEANDVAMAIVSSSRNAKAVLAAADLTGRFPVVVDGTTAAAESLAGKPAPDMFLRAATLLQVEPEACVVVEDAVAGVQAGAAGPFALVVGVDRGGNRQALAEAGASLVIDDLRATLPTASNGAGPAAGAAR